MGFVDSRRGAEGGYFLIRPAEALTLGQVVRAVDHPKNGLKHQEDAFSHVWTRVDTAVSDVLDKTTFADLAQFWQERHSDYIPNWDI